MGFPLPWPHGYTPSSTRIAGTELVYDTGVVAKAKSRLLQQFKGKPRIEALVSLCVAPFQAAEVAAWQLLVERTLDTATDHALRVIAHLVGVRGYDSSSDSLLRRFSRASILVRRSSGRSEDLIGIVRAFTGSTAIRLRRHAPASITVRLREELDGYEAMLLGMLLRRAATGGVRMTFEFLPQPQALEETFRFSTSLTDTEPSDAVGFADDAGTIGGRLAGATTGDER